MARFYRKIVKKIAPELVLVLNSELQGFSGEKSALYKIWWGSISQVLTVYREEDAVLVGSLIY